MSDPKPPPATPPPSELEPGGCAPGVAAEASEAAGVTPAPAPSALELAGFSPGPAPEGFGVTPRDPEAAYPAELYEALHRGNPEDLAFYLEQTAGAAQVLELGCGYGRVLAALAERGGAALTGVDLHPGLLARARARLGDRARILAADMRRLQLQERFDAVLIPYSGFLCLLTDEDAQATLRCAHQHLRPSGRLLFDLYIPPADWRDVSDEELEEPYVESQLDPVQVGEVEYALRECSLWEPSRQRMDVVYRHTPADGAQGAAREGHIQQRYLFPEQVEQLCAQAGFTAELWPDFGPGPVGSEHRILGVLARPR